MTIHYLEQKAPVTRPPVPVPAKKLALMRAETPPLTFYRFLFNGVGEEHRWVSRRYLSDDALKALIHRDDVYIYPLILAGSSVGFGELDARIKGEVCIKFFGLLPEARRLGLGRWFFREMTDLAWSLRPGRVIIETCSLDSPRALQLYQREGFTLYDRAHGVIEWYG